MKRLLISFGFFAHASAALAATPLQMPVIKYPITGPIPSGVPSEYTDRLPPVLKAWPRREIPAKMEQSSPLWIRTVHSETQSFHVGIIKRLLINAPLKRVEAVVDDFENYKIVFPSLKSVEILQQDGNLLRTRWEHRAPLFFLPNASYEQTYIIDKSNPKKLIYRYQMIVGNHIEHTDGFFVLEAVDDQHTTLTGYDFFMPDLGPLKVFGASRVWNDASEGSFKGDMSMKLHAENPSWDADKIKEETEKALAASTLFPLKEIESGPFAPKPTPAPSAAPTPSPSVSAPPPSPAASVSPLAN